MRERSESVIGFKVSPEDRALVQRRAKVSGMSTSEYLRFAVLVESLTAADTSAMKLVGRSLLEKVMRVIEQREAVGRVRG